MNRGPRPEPVEFDHLILTRFSAVVVDDQPPPLPEWLDYRWEFFVQACVPSIQSQTSRDFRWLVWFDDRCPDDFREDVEELAVGAFEPIWTHTNFWEDLAPQVASRSIAPWLLTTRLDSDDALARDFVAAVQREVRPVDRLVIDFPRGLQVDRSGAVYQDHLRSNHFASLLARRGDEPVTAFVAPHARLGRHTPVRRVVTEPMWLEVLHGANVSNALRGTRADPRVVADRFAVDLAYRSTVDRTTLRSEQRARSRTLWRERLTSPHTALTWMRSTSDRVRGTRTVAQQRGPSVGERIQAVARLRRRLRIVRR